MAGLGQDFIIFNYIYACVYMYVPMGMCTWVCAHGCGCLGKPEVGIESPGAGVTDGYELPDISAGD